MTEPTPETPTETPPAATVTVEDLAKVQAALDKERDLRKAAEKEAKDGRAAKARIEEIEAAGKPELERAVEAARKEGRAEAAQAANARLIAAEARALAAESKFRNPATAVRLLDLADVSVTDDGQVDTDALKSRLEALAKDEPYLLSTDTPAVPPAGQAGIGVAGSGAPTDGSPRSLITAGLSQTTRS